MYRIWLMRFFGGTIKHCCWLWCGFTWMPTARKQRRRQKLSTLFTIALGFCVDLQRTAVLQSQSLRLKFFSRRKCRPSYTLVSLVTHFFEGKSVDKSGNIMKLTSSDSFPFWTNPEPSWVKNDLNIRSTWKRLHSKPRRATFEKVKNHPEEGERWNRKCGRVV